MSDDRDRLVQELFAEADEELPAAPFVTAVEAKLAARRARQWPVSIGLAAAAALCAILLAAPLQDAALWLSHALMTPLVAVPDPALAALLLPVNTAAAPAALGLLLLRFAWRRLAA